MNTAVNVIYTGWLNENCYFVREIFLVQEISNFLLLGGIFSTSRWFPVALKEGAG